MSRLRPLGSPSHRARRGSRPRRLNPTGLGLGLRSAGTTLLESWINRRVIKNFLDFYHRPRIVCTSVIRDFCPSRTATQVPILSPGGAQTTPHPRVVPVEEEGPRGPGGGRAVGPPVEPGRPYRVPVTPRVGTRIQVPGPRPRFTSPLSSGPRLPSFPQTPDVPGGGNRNGTDPRYRGTSRRVSATSGPWAKRRGEPGTLLGWCRSNDSFVSEHGVDHLPWTRSPRCDLCVVSSLLSN